jgi:quercetin dioxygenase-like cupin family protein
MSFALPRRPSGVGTEADPVRAERLTFLDGPLPARFRLRGVTLEPGGSRPYRTEDWADALVVVERGEIELECRAGGRRRFPAGAVMWLQGMDLHALHNPGPQPAVLSAVSRRLPGGPTG